MSFFFQGNPCHSLAYISCLVDGQLPVGWWGTKIMEYHPWAQGIGHATMTRIWQRCSIIDAKCTGFSLTRWVATQRPVLFGGLNVVLVGNSFLRSLSAVQQAWEWRLSGLKKRATGQKGHPLVLWLKLYSSTTYLHWVFWHIVPINCQVVPVVHEISAATYIYIYYLFTVIVCHVLW